MNKTSSFAIRPIYMVLSSNYDAAISALNAGGSNVATTMAGYTINDTADKHLSGKGAGSGYYDNAQSGESYYWIVVMSNGGAVADGQQYYSTSAITYSTMNDAGAIATGSNVPTNFSLVDTSKNLFTGNLERHILHCSQHGSLTDFAVGIEIGYKMQGNQVKHFLLVRVHTIGTLSRRDDGMVVGNLLVVKYLFCFGEATF